MPHRNARAVPTTSAAQRAVRYSARSESKASSEVESQSVAAPENGNHAVNPAVGPNAVNEAVLEEL